MAKGMFTQSVSLLTNGQTTIANVKSILRQNGFEIVKESPAQENWSFGGPSLLVAFQPKLNGYAAVDIVQQPWPDSMGNPKTDLATFGAWSMGHFGPLAFPGGLARARQHAWSWQPARAIADDHRGFIRIRISYVLGANKDLPVFPENYDSLAEMRFLSSAVMALLQAHGVLCYFNPNGEVLRDQGSFQDYWNACEEQQKQPLGLWMNIRFFNLNENLGFMDTVGNGQLDLQDVEAVFPLRDYEPRDIDYYLRNVTHYLMGLDRELKTGEEIDGPGEGNLSWTMEVHDQGVIEPPRQVLRLYPKANGKAVREALSAVTKSQG